jgi:hypothetical protein
MLPVMVMRIGNNEEYIAQIEKWVNADFDNRSISPPARISVRFEKNDYGNCLPTTIDYLLHGIKLRCLGQSISLPMASFPLSIFNTFST